MRLGSAAVRRIWTVELHPRAGGPDLVCAQCTARTPACETASARSATLAHLACHARLRTARASAPLPVRGPGLPLASRHRGCAGPVLLALTQGRGGRAWRLADTCAACAAATTHTAIVPDTHFGKPKPSSTPVPARRGHPAGAEERLRVRETLTYLAAALPQFTSAAARLLAVQCTLRVNTHGPARMPAGLLHGMRLRGGRTSGRNLPTERGSSIPTSDRLWWRYTCSTPPFWTRSPATDHAAAPPTGRCSPHRCACPWPRRLRCLWSLWSCPRTAPTAPCATSAWIR